MAKWASGDSAASTEHKIEEFAEDLGGLLGTARAKAEGWLGQRQEIVKHLSEIRDTATKLLSDLGQHAEEVVHRRRRGHPPGSHNPKVTVVDIDDTTSVLRAKREALLDQLDAVDRALAALTAAGSSDANAQELQTAKPAVNSFTIPALAAGGGHATPRAGRTAGNGKLGTRPSG